MKTNRLFIIAALLGTALAGCQKINEVLPEQKPVEGQTWKLTVQAATIADTRAMDLVNNKTLNTYWAMNEKVTVFFEGEPLGSLTVTATENNGASATLSGEITKPDGLVQGSSLMLLFPGRTDNAWTYLGQDGTGPDAAGALATGFDYSTASLTVSSLDAATMTITVSGDVAFTSQQSIYRFAFQTGNSYLTAKTFTLTSNQNNLVRSRLYDNGAWASTTGALTVTPAANYAPSDNLYYMAIRNENTSVADTYTFTVVGGDDALYEGSKQIPTTALGNKKFLKATINMSHKAFAPTANATEFEVL